VIPTRRLPRRLLVIACLCALCVTALAAQVAPKILWGDDVPKGWAGVWPSGLQTRPERTAFTRTTSTADLLDFVDAIRWKSEWVHVFPAFTSPLGKIAPAIVLARPRVTSPAEALASGKAVIYLQGNIHPPEPEGTEALLFVIRDVLFGRRQHLLDHQILVILPVFNMDGTDMLFTQDGTPHIAGARVNAAGFDLNRDAVKLETAEVAGLYQNVLNRWDPLLFVDLHLMGRVKHGYANTYATSTVPAASASPREYVWNTLFPAVREAVRRDFRLETFTHALPDNAWPPTVWSHDNAIWSTEAKFVVTDYGLRNRMAIITETPGHPTFERRIYAQYAYVLALLEYTNAHASEMMAVVKAADDETVARVKSSAEQGALRNWLEGKYESRGKVEILAYPANDAAFLPGTSVRGTKPGQAVGEPQRVVVDDLTKPVGTREAAVPRGYVLPASLADIAAKLRLHNVKVQTLDAPVTVEGEQFVVNRLTKVRRGGLNLTVLDGAMAGISTRVFPAGSFLVDLAQPMANAAFYYLEPQAADGFAGAGMLDAPLQALGLGEHPVVYPIFKYRRVIAPAK
jgi:hypothetical protein